ncbi:MAG TPA: TlpA disulfide reductase family protein [Armatimonadota bacterium]|jgi:thiol-disulfide isomerase/thioredoxin
MPMRMGTPLPSLAGASEWVNGEVNNDELTGENVLVHFWSTSCGSCHEIMPKIKEWKETYGPRGLRFVGIHMPRSEKDTDVDAVKADIDESGLTWPQAIDNQHSIKEAFGNQYVPAFYVFNEQGVLRHFQAGDRGVKMLEGAIERVLKPKE